VSDKVLYEKRGEVAYVTLNRPEVKNAIDREMSDALTEIWTDFAADPHLRVAVLTGAGDAFTSGGDLRSHAPEWADGDPMSGRKRLEDGLSGITRGPLAFLPKPIIASINGWCLGHGVEIAMACDLRIASENAHFGTFEVRRGMHSADGGIVRLVNCCGLGFAMELLLTGEAVTAERAYHANMVNKVVPHDELETATDLVVQQILRCDPAAVASSKQTALEIIGRPLHDQLRLEGVWGYNLCASSGAAFAERQTKFLEKNDAGRAGATATPLT
jgi:enoyl-CoA hydratase/carnithine racemase